MPPLSNPQFEQFAQLVASGKHPTESYISLGKSTNGAAQCALRLKKKANVATRIAEIQCAIADNMLTRVALDRDWVLKNLKSVAERCMEAEQVFDHEGKPTGEYTFQASGANRALELIGKELGMFIDRTKNEHTFKNFDEMIASAPVEQLKEWLGQAEGAETIQ